MPLLPKRMRKGWSLKNTAWNEVCTAKSNDNKNTSKTSTRRNLSNLLHQSGQSRLLKGKKCVYYSAAPQLQLSTYIYTRSCLATPQQIRPQGNFEIANGHLLVLCSQRPAHTFIHDFNWVWFAGGIASVAAHCKWTNTILSRRMVARRNIEDAEYAASADVMATETQMEMLMGKCWPESRKKVISRMKEMFSFI